MKKLLTILPLLLFGLLLTVADEEPGKEGVPDRKIVVIPDKDGWITREIYDGSGHLTVWESANAKRCLLTYNKDHRLVRLEYPDGTVMSLLYPKGGAGRGEERDAAGKLQAKLQLDATNRTCARLDPDTAKPLPKRDSKGFPDIEYFLGKAADLKKGQRERESGYWKYDDEGRPTIFEIE